MNQLVDVAETLRSATVKIRSRQAVAMVVALRDERPGAANRAEVNRVPRERVADGAAVAAHVAAVLDQLPTALSTDDNRTLIVALLVAAHSEAPGWAP